LGKRICLVNQLSGWSTRQTDAGHWSSQWLKASIV
jgi:hypothetical protein